MKNINKNNENDEFLNRITRETGVHLGTPI